LIMSGGAIQQMINSIRANKRPRRKVYGSYKAYENSKAQERAERRIYQYAESSQKHLRLIRKRLNKERKALMQKKVAVLTVCIIVGAFIVFIILY